MKIRHWLRKFFFGSSRRSVITILGAVILLVIAWNFFNKPAAPQYQTAQAEKGTLVTTVSASGTVSSGSMVSITTSVTGVVTNVYVQNGDSVIQGQKIADITLDQSAQQKQAQAWAAYLNAQASLDSAKSKLNSLQSALFKANQAFLTDRGVSNPTDQQKADPKYIEEQADWQQAEADYTNQQTVINSAQASVTSSWLAYQQLSPTITAPTSGIINGLSISEGSSIQPQSGSATTGSSSQPVGTITLPSGSLQATVSLSEVDVPRVGVGQKATMTLDAFPNKTFTGKVTSIDTSGTINSGVTTYSAVITFDSPDSKIYSNMAVNAKIITEVKDNVLLIPSTAIQTVNGQATVRILKNGQLQSVSVETGDANDTDTEISSGLSAGDTVATSVITPSGSRATSSPFGGTGFGGGGRVFFNTGGGIRRGG